MKKIVLMGLMFMMFMGVVSASSINGEYKGKAIVNAIVNDKAIVSSVPAIIYNGSTLIPLRSTLEVLGAQVTWNAKTNTAKITTDKKVQINTTNVPTTQDTTLSVIQ